MSKKDYIIKILNALINDRPLAKSILTLVENDQLDDQKINAITNIFRNAVNNVHNKIQHTKLQKSISYLDKIKQQEQLDGKVEQEDLVNLEKDIENL